MIKKCEIDLADWIITVAALFLIFLGEYMALIALCAFCSTIEIGRMRKAMEAKDDQQKHSQISMEGIGGA